MRLSSLVTRLLVAALALTVAGCARDRGRPPEEGAITLTGAGASFPYPLYSRWFDEYDRVEPQVRINYQSIGSGGGIQQLKANTVDFGASDAPLSDKEAEAMPSPVVHIPIVAGAVVVAYNLPGIERPLRLSADTLAGTYLGDIKRWNDRRLASVNPGAMLPDLSITVAHRSDGSGTTNIFTEYLSTVSTTWAQRVGAGKSVDWPTGVGGKGNEGVTGLVRNTPGAIGYVELAYAIQNNLSRVHLRNAAGNFVDPTLSSTTAAAAGAVETMKRRNDARVSIVNSPDPAAYPIAGFTYILVYREQPDQAKGEALARFLDWAIHDGQEFAESLHYARLPEELVTINEAAVRSLEYEGRSLLGDR